MLVHLKEILDMAEKKKMAVGAFNTPNLECLTAVLEAAEAAGSPVIISHAELHEPIASLDVIGPVMVLMAERAKVPVCVHLDHGENLAYLQKALDIGFTGIMYDGSLLPYEENMANTRLAAGMARKANAGVEAEIGVMGGREAGTEAESRVEDLYTDPELARRFVVETGIDALAASFGTVHGIYKVKPVLDVERIGRISALTGVPLVMHGGSGCSDSDYHAAIQNGVRKINYYSYMAREGVYAASKLLDSSDVVFYHELAYTAAWAMKEDAARAINVFMNQK